ncbi:MAG TPA: Ig-like domain-containing protein [Candidatus Saccharimonadales bacterium]
MPFAAPVVPGTQAVWAADSCTAPATDYGTDTMSVSIPSTASYTVWTHIKIPSSSANSILLNVGGTCYNVGGSAAIPANTWEWINYYDGKTASVATQSLTQGSKSVALIGTSTGVLVDQVEFVPGSCVPTGNGSNCTAATTTTGGTTTGGSGTTTTGGGTSTGRSGGGGSGPTKVVSGGTFTPSTTSTPTQVTAPVTLQPTLSDPGDGNVIEVQYYLNNKLIATLTTTPFAYKLDTTKILNGTYTLTTKKTYDSGHVVSTSQKIIVKNPASLEQLMLAARHYIVIELIALVILFIGCRLFLKRLKLRRPTAGSLSPAGTADAYGPLTYAPSSPYPTETQPTASQFPVQPVNGSTPPADNGGGYGALPYSNTPPAPESQSPLPQPQQIPPAGVSPSGDENKLQQR